MKKTYIALAVALVLVVALGWLAIKQFGMFESHIETETLGTFAYECDGQVTFSITPAADMSTLVIRPESGSYPPSATLAHVPTNSGARYEGAEGLVLVAHGETVILGEGDEARTCAPVQTPGEAPFNFGD